MKKPILLIIFLFCVSLFSCSKKNIATVEDLDNNFNQKAKDMPFAGFAVSIFNEDKILYQKAFGQADVAKNTPYTNQTLQPIASISKTFIAVALMKAVEQGFFSLETNINEVLPFPVKNPNSPNTPIKIKHLVNHTSGLIDVEKTYLKSHSILTGENVQTPIAQRLINEVGFGQNSTVLSLKDFLKGYYTEGGTFYSSNNFAKAEAGANYSYSNIASALVAYLIEVKAGKSFADYCTENIFKPLGMSNSAWSITADNRAKLARLHWTKSEPLPYYTAATYPDGGLITSNEDLSKFFLEMIKGFSGKSTFLNKSSFELMFQKSYLDSKKPTNMNEKEDNYGVFWVYFKNGRIGHSGGDFGVTTLMAFYPDSKKGFLFMINSEIAELDGAAHTKAESNLQNIVDAIRSFESNN
jgi:CubicO group peptidase (beta-lactamase class C family)